MGKLRNKLIGLGVGVVLFVLWTRLSGPDGALDEAEAVPSRVFDGGGGTMEVRFTTNQPADLVFAFEQYDEATEETRSAGGRERFDPGTHSRTIDVSPATYIYLELGVPEATPGAELSWTIAVDGRDVLRESDRLDAPLASGYAFFLQAEAEDIAGMRAWR